MDKSLPVAWGAHKGAKLIRIGTRLYAPCDPEYISQISKVYDRDGNVVPASSLIPGKLVEINPNASSITPHTCDFDGRRRDRIGEIIIDEIEAKSRIPYTAGNWDTSESNRYISTSPKVGIVVYRGKVRELIATCLKNDSAFLIIKNDGRFSLRGWDMTYNTHSIPKWRLTKMPRKTHLEETFFTSSVRVHYNYRHDTKKYQSSFLLDTEEEKIYGELHARQRREIKTDLTSEVDAKRIAGVLLGRFRRRNEIFQVAVGYDTSEINPLDTVELDMDVNGRRFSLHKRWRVREVNPAQDTLKLEAIGG